MTKKKNIEPETREEMVKRFRKKAERYMNDSILKYIDQWIEEEIRIREKGGFIK